MSYKLVDRVLKESKYKGIKKLILVTIARYASGNEDDNEAFPSQATLADEVGIGERQLAKYTHDLSSGEDCELDIKEVGNGHRSTRYHLNFRSVEPSLPPPPPPALVPAAEPVPAESTPGPLSTTTQGGYTDPPNQLLNQPFNQKNLPTEAVGEKNSPISLDKNLNSPPSILILTEEDRAAILKREEEHKARIREALDKGIKRFAGKVRADLTWVPEELMPLIEMFVDTSKIIPIKSDYAFWIKETREQIEAGIRPRDIKAAVQYAREQGMTIKSPKSITVFARDSLAKHKAEMDSMEGSSRNSDGSYNL